MGIRRRLADIVEVVIRARIIHPYCVGDAFEEFHLKRFFSYFQIDRVCDIGANSGQYVELLRNRVGFF